MRKHLAGWITVGLYAINPQSQRCKWIAIDADYHDAFFDLGKLKGELELDGVSAALEMSRRGGHLWIFCERPLLAEQCRVYIYNVALRLGGPIKGAAGRSGTHRPRVPLHWRLHTVNRPTFPRSREITCGLPINRERFGQSTCTRCRLLAHVVSVDGVSRE